MALRLRGAGVGGGGNFLKSASERVGTQKGGGGGSLRKGFQPWRKLWFISIKPRFVLTGDYRMDYLYILENCFIKIICFGFVLNKTYFAIKSEHLFRGVHKVELCLNLRERKRL